MADHSRQDPSSNFSTDEDGELGDKVQQVRAELESLKLKQEEIEREKARLEDLKRRQDSLEHGRSDMLDKLTRALVVVERETEEAQKRVEQMHQIHSSFTQHLRDLEAINARSWLPQDLPKELSRALSAVDNARADFTKSHAKLAVESQELDHTDHASPDQGIEFEDRSFGVWLKMGFAFTLPLQILALVALLLHIWATTAVR